MKIMKKLLLTLCILIAGASGFILFEMNKSVEQVFPKQTEVFGIKVYATKGFSDEKIKHVKAVISEYLDNDEDGQVDNPQVLNAIVKSGYGMMLTKNEKESMKIFLLNVKVHPLTNKMQELYDMETHPNGASKGVFDGTLEETLHLITQVGYANVYPEVWGEKPGSKIARIMDEARGGHFVKIPNKYPETAWYTYYDDTADYGTMVTEYVYWSLTSMLGGQDFNGRYEEISDEWKLNTRDLLMAKDPKVVELLMDPEYKMPRVLPDGKYRDTY